MKPEKICIQQFAEYQLPPVNNQLHKGLAGAIIGVCQGRIIIAGGSNFDNGYPWQGGIKKYFKDIYWADVKSCIESTTFRLLDNVKLPEAIAYGANVSTQNGLYSIGGENEKGELNEVLCITWEDSTASIQSAVAYPIPIANSGATNIGTNIYVAGGVSQGMPTSRFFRLDCSNLKSNWEELAQMPIPLANALVVSQWDGVEQCVYVIGGRIKTDTVSTFLNTNIKYSPSSNRWTYCSPVRINGIGDIKLAAGTGIPFGKDKIIMFSGDPGVIYNQVEALIYAMQALPEGFERNRLKHIKDSLQQNHPGFSDAIIGYSTLSDGYKMIGRLEGHPQVTTTAILVDDMVFIPSGEIRPGVRTPMINVLRITTNQ